ncbi:3-oxoadipate enol-lactonase 2 [Tolypocladium ophioglossoides CBS 100239]|uniref:3-oxoadipate enol-lactonase 2 n=1 Tax=Tolypocladium ophioglossoides (strain CBS 100239) TaxID=1163406 RepID=A0A0L0NJN3_TOLOC|nr:3-oxoadipate enol-lactonase 2 [Tolypocladium ophioglossoides CBS 100239]
MSAPGILYVTIQPRRGLPPAQFHEWYNNEHGPARLRMPHIFSSGLRYESRRAGPEAESGAAAGAARRFMAVYDVTAMRHLASDAYGALRAGRSVREAATMGQVDVARSCYDLLFAKQAPRFAPLESLGDGDGAAAGIVTVAVAVATTAAPRAGERYRTWFVDEHVGMLAGVPGWLRSRLFKTSSVEAGAEAVSEYLALHDYAGDHGLGGAAHAASLDTPWRRDVLDECVAAEHRRTWSLLYVFGPAPRDLAALSALPRTAAFTSADKRTSTAPGPDAAISSYATTADALSIPYRLQGNPSPRAPTVAFCNSLLTSLHMWDPLVAILQRTRPDLRILRYDARGRHPIPQPPVSATLDALAADLDQLLGALRITQLHALVGVSLGGATALNFAIRHPRRLAKLIACDFNAASSAANTQAWKGRVAVAEGDAGRGITTLAEQTVARWFHPASMAKTDVVRCMTDMVAANDVQGFKHSCTALWDYNMEPEMRACPVPALLVVGEGDAKGALVKAMDGFRGMLGQNGAELRIVPNAGHLPMCEQPQAFWEAIRDFL